MNKNIFKILFIFVIVTFISTVKADVGVENTYVIKSYTNPSTNYRANVDDTADLLTEIEEEQLLEQMKPLTDFGNIVLKSTNYNNYYSVKEYADNYYYDNYGISSGTILLIDMDTRELFIYSNGNNYNIINDNKGYSITDNIYRYASVGNYYGCAEEAFYEIGRLLNGHKINEPMRIICNVIISIVLASYIGFFIVYFKYKLKKTGSSEVLKHSSSTFVVNNVKAIQTGKHKVYNPRTDSSSSGGFSSSGGGHSSGGGSFGGGGSHGGGGGGHRF